MTIRIRLRGCLDDRRLPAGSQANCAGASHAPKGGAGSFPREAHSTPNASRTAAARRRSAPAPKSYPGDRACARAVNCLRQAAGGIVTREELMAWVYGDRRDGGPQSPGILSLIVCHLRRMGFPIVTHWGRGYRYQPRIWELT